MINICVCGWYYRPECLSVLDVVKKTYPVQIVANERNFNVQTSIPFEVRKNIGLEWGAYDYYLKNIWDGESDVLFMHDDIRFRPVIKEYQIVSPVKIFNSINKLNHDQVYIFESLQKAEKNYFIHGRMLKCSARFLRRMLDDIGGFPYDPDNDGHIQGPTPKHCKPTNYGDYKLTDYIKPISREATWKVGSYVIIPALECATRGRFDNEIEGPVEE